MITVRSRCLCMLSIIFCWNVHTLPIGDPQVLETYDKQTNFFNEQKAFIRKFAPVMFLGWPEIVHANYVTKPLPTDYDASIAQSEEHKRLMTYVATVFGKNGLAIDADLLTYIKQFYFYFEYLVRLEKSVKIATKADEKKIDWKNVVKQKGWSALATMVGSLDAVEATMEIWNALFTTDTDLLVSGTQSNDFWRDLQKSSWWSIPVSIDEMRNSMVWQDYLKCMISNSIYCNADYCKSKEGAAYNLIQHIQNLESAYYIPDFTYERHQYETAQLSILLNDKIRTRLLEQCPSWNNVPLISKKDQQDLITAAQEFYKYNAVMQTFLSMSDPKVLGKVTINDFKANSMLEQQEKRIIGMAMTLGLLIQDLFDDYKTAQQTVTKLKRIPLATFESSKNVPSLLLYQPQDASYILDLAYLHERVRDNAERNVNADSVVKQFVAADGIQTSGANDTKEEHNKSSAATVPVSSSSIFDSIGDWFKGAANTVKGWGENIYADFFTSNGIFASFGKLTYYGSGMAMAFENASWDDCKKNAASIKDDLMQDIHDVGQTGGSIVGAAASFVAKALTMGQLGAEFPLALAGVISAGIFDHDFFSDVEGMYTQVGDMVGSYFGHFTEMYGTGVVVLAGEGVTFFTGIIFQTCMGNWKGLGDTFLTFGKDLISGLLQGLVIAIDLLKSEWDIIGKAIGYLVKSITDLIIDVVASSMVLFTGQFNQFAQAKAQVAQHKRLIAQGVGVALFIGAAVATGGLGGAVGAAFFAATFAIPSLTSGVQQDDAAEEARQELNEYLKHFAVMIQNQSQVSEAMNQEYERDVKAQYDAAWINQKLANGFSENEQNAALDSFECGEAYALGAYQKQQLQVDAAGLSYADPGITYKYHTGWYNLNPSQGIVLYEPSRGSFAQEAAVTPNVIMQGEEQTKKTETLFWFLQNVTNNVNRSTKRFEIRFRPLYLLDHFYIGIGMGGIPFNADQVMKSGLANLDQYYHAKMVVFHKDNMTGANTNIGVYEHESSLVKNGWLVTNPLQENDHLIPGTWYHLVLELPANSTVLSYKAWKEADQKMIASGTTNVTKLEDRDFVVNRGVCPVQKGTGPVFDSLPLMVIFSGASIEWKVVDPKEEYTSLQTQNDREEFANMKTEATAEINKKQYADNHTIKEPFPGLSLASSSYDAMKGYYVYTTNKTTNVVGKGNILDYLVLGTWDARANALKSYGNSPLQKNNNSALSLVSGMVYQISSDGSLTPQSYANVWQAYKKDKSLSSELINKIEIAQHDYFGQKNSKNVWGLFTLSPYDAELKNGNSVYTTQLRLDPDMHTTQLQDDIVILVSLDPFGTVRKINLPLGNNDANGLLSLTTGLIYEKTANPFIIPSVDWKTDTARVDEMLKKLTDTALKNDIGNKRKTYETFMNQYKQKPTPATEPVTPQQQPMVIKTDDKKGGKGTILIQQSGSEDVDLNF